MQVAEYGSDCLMLADSFLRMQTGATPDHCLLVWHVLVDVPTRVYPARQL